MREKHLMQIERTKRVDQPVFRTVPRTKRSPTSPLAIHQDRFTYTFILNSEIISIHYDRIRGEVFYQGHNIKNIDMDKNKMIALESVISVLNDDEEGKLFIDEYKATLNRHLTDNK